MIGLHADRLPGGGFTVQLGWYGTAVSGLITAKLLLSLLIGPTRATRDSAAMLASAQVAVVITLYNEDPAAFGRCLDSLLAQTRLPDAVTVVDDCSRTRHARRTPSSARWSSEPTESTTP